MSNISIMNINENDVIKLDDNLIIKVLHSGLNDGIWKIEINNNISELSIKEFLELLLCHSKYGNSIFTHNCQQRLICGQLGSIASRMALDDNQATTIDGTHKGAGMVKAQGIVTNIQYYFEQQKWINQWFLDRGLTEKGWNKDEDPNAITDPDSIDLGEDEEISIDDNRTRIEFNGISKEIDNNKDQKFEEI